MPYVTNYLIINLLTFRSAQSPRSPFSSQIHLYGQLRHRMDGACAREALSPSIHLSPYISFNDGSNMSGYQSLFSARYILPARNHQVVHYDTLSTSLCHVSVRLKNLCFRDKSKPKTIIDKLQRCGSFDTNQNLHTD